MLLSGWKEVIHFVTVQIIVEIVSSLNIIFHLSDMIPKWAEFRYPSAKVRAHEGVIMYYILITRIDVHYHK